MDGHDAIDEIITGLRENWSFELSQKPVNWRMLKMSRVCLIRALDASIRFKISTSSRSSELQINNNAIQEFEQATSIQNDEQLPQIYSS